MEIHRKNSCAGCNSPMADRDHLFVRVCVRARVMERRLERECVRVCVSYG